MKAYIYLEERFIKNDNNEISSSLGTGDDFWARYLNVFEEIFVVARVTPTQKRPANAKLISDPRIKFIEIPHYQGAFDFAKKFIKVILAIRAAAKPNTSHILRLPGLIGTTAHFFLKQKGIPYAVELVGDPWDVFAPNGVGGIFSPLFRAAFTSYTKSACTSAAGVSYVTQRTMQKRYPPHKDAFHTYYSSIQLPSNLISKCSRTADSFIKNKYRILLIGSMEQLYKGFDTMIDAIALSKESQELFDVYIAGEGRYKKTLEQQAKNKGVASSVHFMGKLNREEIITALDDSDIFAMPSKTEGLPRALIEAMARGLPAIGSDVGGIPELLENKYLFKPSNPQQINDLLQYLIKNPHELATMSKKNIENSKSYCIENLSKRQREFYLHAASISAPSLPQ